MPGDRPHFNFPFLHVPGLTDRPYLLGGRNAYRPLIPLTVFGPAGRGLRMVAWVDSGADLCLFHQAVADYVGVEFTLGGGEWVRRYGERVRVGWRDRLAGAVERLVGTWVGGHARTRGLHVRYGRVALQLQAEDPDGRRLRWRWPVVAGFAAFRLDDKTEALTGLLGLHGGLDRFQTTFHYPLGRQPQITMLPYATDADPAGT
jgi:hypothetical protein